MIMTHSFDIEIAEKYGVESAIIIHNLDFWLEKNAANEKHYHDGFYWTYNSAEAFAKLFPYWNAHKIRRVLKRMQEQGILQTGNYNQHAYDRTIWYSFTEAFMSEMAPILRICKMVFTDSQNAINGTATPIPDSNTDTKPDRKLEGAPPHGAAKTAKEQPYQSDFEEWWRLYPRKKEKKRAYKQYAALRRKGVDKQSLLDAVKGYTEECRKDGREERFIKHAATFLGPAESWREYVENGDEISSKKAEEKLEMQRVKREISYDDYIARLKQLRGEVS